MQSANHTPTKSYGQLLPLLAEAFIFMRLSDMALLTSKPFCFAPLVGTILTDDVSKMSLSFQSKERVFYNDFKTCVLKFVLRSWVLNVADKLEPFHKERLQASTDRSRMVKHTINKDGKRCTWDSYFCGRCHSRQ